MAYLNIPWLAFCSGPYLKSEDRWIPPPSWDQATMYDRSSNNTSVFKDGLGLPINVELYSTNQPLWHYRTVGFTNVLGWNFPQEFHLAQYRRNFQTGVWELHLTAWGKLTTIGAGSEPCIPTKTQKAIEK
jgi:hypothetical protein